MQSGCSIYGASSKGTRAPRHSVPPSGWPSERRPAAASHVPRLPLTPPRTTHEPHRSPLSLPPSPHSDGVPWAWPLRVLCSVCCAGVGCLSVLSDCVWTDCPPLSKVRTRVGGGQCCFCANPSHAMRPTHAVAIATGMSHQLVPSGLLAAVSIIASVSFSGLLCPDRSLVPRGHPTPCRCTSPEPSAPTQAGAGTSGLGRRYCWRRPRGGRRTAPLVGSRHRRLVRCGGGMDWAGPWVEA